MPELKPLLKVSYGSQSTPIPVYEDKSLTNGTMYVHTSNISDGAAVNPIYDAKLYFDLGNKRYHILGDKLSALKNLSLVLGNDIDSTKNITNLGVYNGTIADNLTWVIPYASSTSSGLISKYDGQHIAGTKIFDGTITFDDKIITKAIEPAANNTYNLGSTGENGKRWNYIYANHFVGTLTGNADTATLAYATDGVLTFSKALSDGFVNDVNNPIITARTFNGSANLNITIHDFTDENGKLPLSVMPAGALERIFTYNSVAAAQAAILAGDIQPGDLIKTNDNKIMYYVADVAGGINSSNVAQALQEFKAGIAIEADHVSENLVVQVTRGQAQEVELNGLTVLVKNIIDSITYNGGIQTSLELNVTQEPNYTEGDHIATILGTPIYAGIAWETF